MGLFDTTKEWDEALERWEGIGSAPARHNRPNPRGVTVLKNKVLETYFTSSHWATPALWFGPIMAYGLYWAIVLQQFSAAKTAGWFAFGIVAWTFAEYVIHRFFFHLQPNGNVLVRTMLFIAHGYHHEFPQDRRRLVAPPVLAWPIAIVVGLFYYLVANPVWPLLFAGTITGYLAYDWTHYYTHHAKPTTRVGKWMRRFHFEHHFKDETTQFGLSQPFWDLVFGTFRKPTAATAVEKEVMGTDARQDRAAK